MPNPYENLPARAFWRSAVSDLSPLEFKDIYRPKFTIDKTTSIAAAGSCFAQHLGRQFKQRGYNYLDLEPPPEQLPAAKHEAFGFNLYSARYGNVYSVRQLLQLFNRAYGKMTPAESVWQTRGRFFDPFRPAIEPNGFASEEEVRRDVAFHLRMVRYLLAKADLFVFTFGLTEAWECKADGAILPTCPGTVAGEFDPERYAFKNFRYDEIMADAESFIAMALECKPDMKFLFTVSPVPLTATASGQHVLPASVYSKSVLRAVCGDLADKYDQVDYFPSYELVASHPMRAMFFQPNLRSVSPVGVQHVMNTFFAAHGETGAPEVAETATETSARQARTEDDLICEEALLEAFAS